MATSIFDASFERFTNSMLIHTARTPGAIQIIRLPCLEIEDGVICQVTRPGLVRGFLMHVCMLGYTYYEIDSRVRQYGGALVERGDQVDFIGLGKAGQPTEDVVEDVRVFRIQRREHDETGKFSYLFKLLRFLVSSSIRLTKEHRRNRYDLIHIHSVPDFLVFAAWLPRLMGAKIVLDIHDVIPELYATKFNVPPGALLFRSMLLMEKLCAGFADHIIISNDIWRQTLLSRSVKASKCTTILNCPTYLVSKGSGERKTDSKFTILYPGSLNHHQGVDVAIRAVALITNKIPELEFHIYGEGKESETLARLIKELGLERHVYLQPYVPQKEILRIMENVDLGVDPKRTDGFANEALGGKILEFMARGVPVIVSDSRTNRYYFDESVVQFFRGGDAEDLARSILSLHDNSEARSSLIQNASQFVRGYQWDLRKSTYLELVDSLTQSSKEP